MPSKFRTKDNVHSQVVDTVACTVKVKIPDTLAHRLDALLPVARGSVQRMLAHRDQSSSKNYPELPCVISKSLIAKYQRNRKCKVVNNLVLPICGDKGRQIKWDGQNIRIPAIFQKQTVAIKLKYQPVADDKHRINFAGEFFQRDGSWYLTLSYRTLVANRLQPTGLVGVDFNSVGHVATLADPATGRVLHLGFSPASTKAAWRGRRANLQRTGKRRLLCKIKRKQSRRTKHENHIASKAITDYAAAHRRAIVVEDLSGVRGNGSRIRSYAERNQWSFYQLLQFIEYKAALRGVEVLRVTAAYSSKECSRCQALNEPAGKKYRCQACGANDHRDANASFTLANRVSPIGGVARDSEGSRSGLLVTPYPGTAPVTALEKQTESQEFTL